MKQVRVGIIGCGGRIRGVAAAVLKNSPHIQVTALSDINPLSIQRSKERLNPDTKVYRDYHDLVRDRDIDWVMVGSWNYVHRDHTVAAFAAGKNVFCEKPLATTLADCRDMYKAWKQSGRLFNIGFTLRYSPHYRKIKELIDAGTIGDLLSMEFNECIEFNHGGFIHGDWRRFTKYAGTHLLEKCSHDIDLANWMVGSRARRVASFGGLDFFLPRNARHIKRVGKNKKGKWAYQVYTDLNPFTTRKDIIDNQVAIIEYENNVRATFHASCNAGIPERRMYLCGTEGAIRGDVMAGTIDVCRTGFDKKTGWNTKPHPVSTGASGGHGGGDDVLAEELADMMLTGKPPKATLKDGFVSAVTCFAIDDAMNKGMVVNVKPYWKKAGL